MSSRQSVYATIRVPVDVGESPNRTVPALTVDLRVFFPPGTDQRLIRGAISQAVTEATDQLIEKEAS